MRKDRDITLLPMVTLGNSSNTEVVDESLRLKDIRPKGAFAYFLFDTTRREVWQTLYNTIQADGVDGVDGVTLIDGEYMSYGIPTHSIEKYTISFNIIPNYNNAPVDNSDWLCLSGDLDNGVAVVRNNFITIRHLNTGVIEVKILTNAGEIITSATYNYLAVSGQQVNITMTLDNTVMQNEIALRLFIDGIQVPCTHPDMAKRLNMSPITVIDRVDIGAIYNVEQRANFTFNQLALFKDIIYTDNFTVSNFPLTFYTTTPENEVLDYIISSERIININKIIASDTVRFIIEVLDDNNNWVGRYYDDVLLKWVNSDGTYLMANTLKNLDERILYHIWHKQCDFRVRVFLASPDGYINSIFELLELKYDWYLTHIPVIEYTLVYGTVSGSDSRQKSDYRITAMLSDRTIYKNRITIIPEIKEATTDERGYWELLLPNTTDMKNNVYFNITIHSTHPRTEMCYIPKVPQIDFEDLVKDYSVVDTSDILLT